MHSSQASDSSYPRPPGLLPTLAASFSRFSSASDLSCYVRMSRPTTMFSLHASTLLRGQCMYSRNHGHAHATTPTPNDPLCQSLAMLEHPQDPVPSPCTRNRGCQRSLSLCISVAGVGKRMRCILRPRASPDFMAVLIPICVSVRDICVLFAMHPYGLRLP